MGAKHRRRARLAAYRFPVLDSGLGRALGYADDQELIAAADAQGIAVERLLSPDVIRRIRDAETALERRLLGV